MVKHLHRERILALDLHRLSFGFAVLEGPDALVDWGVKSFRHGTNAVKVPFPRKLAQLLDEFEPETIVMRIALGVKVDQQTRTTCSLARARHTAIRTMSQENMLQRFFGHNRNKHEIATFVASCFPELADAVPPKRKPWQNEHYRMSIFDALAAGLTYFATAKNNRSLAE